MFADDLVPDTLNLVNNWESDKEFARQFLHEWRQPHYDPGCQGRGHAADKRNCSILR